MIKAPTYKPHRSTLLSCPAFGEINPLPSTSTNNSGNRRRLVGWLAACLDATYGRSPPRRRKFDGVKRVYNHGWKGNQIHASFINFYGLLRCVPQPPLSPTPTLCVLGIYFYLELRTGFDGPSSSLSSAEPMEHEKGY